MKLFEKFTLQRPDQIGYSSLALSKISKLALTGYKSKGAYCPLRTFFMRYLSMRPHIRYAGFEGRTLSSVLVSFCTSLSTDPHGLHQSNDSDVQVLKSKGAHYHA